MNLFGCDEKGLAVALSDDPELYNSIKKSLETLRDRALLNPDYVKTGLSENLSLLERANNLARNSDYFVFEVVDSWAEEVHGNGSGYAVFQKVNDQMVRKLGVRDGIPPQFDEVINALKRHKINRVFTTSIPYEGYFGLKYEEESDDGHCIEYKQVGEMFDRSIILKEFKEEGIELIILD